MILSCREAARLASLRMDSALTLRQRVALGMHLRVCRHCSRYAEQLRLMRALLRRAMEDTADLAGVDAFTLPEADRQRLGRALATAAGGEPG